MPPSVIADVGTARWANCSAESPPTFSTSVARWNSRNCDSSVSSSPARSGSVLGTARRYRTGSSRRRRRPRFPAVFAVPIRRSRTPASEAETEPHHGIGDRAERHVVATGMLAASSKASSSRSPRSPATMPLACSRTIRVHVMLPLSNSPGERVTYSVASWLHGQLRPHEDLQAERDSSSGDSIHSSPRSWWRGPPRGAVGGSGSNGRARHGAVRGVGDPGSTDRRRGAHPFQPGVRIARAAPNLGMSTRKAPAAASCTTHRTSTPTASYSTRSRRAASTTGATSCSTPTARSTTSTRWSLLLAHVLPPAGGNTEFDRPARGVRGAAAHDQGPSRRARRRAQPLGARATGGFTAVTDEMKRLMPPVRIQWFAPRPTAAPPCTSAPTPRTSSGGRSTKGGRSCGSC